MAIPNKAVTKAPTGPANKSTAVKPPAAKAPAKPAVKPKPKPKPVAKPSGKAKPGTKYVKVNVIKNGKTKSVLMEAGKAKALTRSRAINETSNLIPGNLKGLVDVAAIHDAVQSTLDAENAPIVGAQKVAQDQLARNVQANQALSAQAQASLAQAAANAGVYKDAFMQSAGRAQASQQATNEAAAMQMQAMLGNAGNGIVQSVAAAGTAVPQAQQFAENTKDYWAGSLGAQAQQDFIGRLGGITGMEAQRFDRDQRARLGDVMTQLASQIAANKAKAPSLVRQFAQEDYTLASAFAGSQADAALKAKQLEIDAYKAETGRAGVVSTATSKKDAAAAKAAKDTAEFNAKLNAAQQKRVDKVFQDVEKMRARVGTTLMPGQSFTGADGKVVKVPGTKITTDMVFGTNGGPLRKSFDLLRAVGLTKEQAAWHSALLYRSSITRSTPAKIATMWKNRGVAPGATAAIINDVWGAGTYEALGKKPKSPMRPSVGTKLVSVSDILSKLKAQQGNGGVKVGQSFNFGGDRNGKVRSKAKTIAGMTYIVRMDTGKDVTVTVPNAGG